MTNSLPPVKIAFIIDGRVVDLLHTDERLGAILLSNPLILDVTDLLNQNNTTLFVDSKYNEVTNTFIAPQYNENGDLIE